MHVKHLASSPVHNKPRLNYNIITTAIIISGLSRLKKLFHVRINFTAFKLQPISAILFWGSAFVTVHELADGMWLG